MKLLIPVALFWATCTVANPLENSTDRVLKHKGAGPWKYRPQSEDPAPYHPPKEGPAPYKPAIPPKKEKYYPEETDFTYGMPWPEWFWPDNMQTPKHHKYPWRHAAHHEFYDKAPRAPRRMNNDEINLIKYFAIPARLACPRMPLLPTDNERMKELYTLSIQQLHRKAVNEKLFYYQSQDLYNRNLSRYLLGQVCRSHKIAWSHSDDCGLDIFGVNVEEQWTQLADRHTQVGTWYDQMGFYLMVYAWAVALENLGRELIRFIREQEGDVAAVAAALATSNGTVHANLTALDLPSGSELQAGNVTKALVQESDKHDDDIKDPDVQKTKAAELGEDREQQNGDDAQKEKAAETPESKVQHEDANTAGEKTEEVTKPVE